MSNPLNYEGKRVLVAGCFSGMGAAAAVILKDLGAHVTGFDIRMPESQLDEFREVDLKDEGAIARAVGEAASQGPIDNVFYCAGLGPVHPPLDVMRVNFLGLRDTVEACIPHMPRGGSIATISSGAGVGYLVAMGDVLEFLAIEDRTEACRWIESRSKAPDWNAYVFSKQCIIVYTARQGVTLAPDNGVRINCISPGPTATPMMPDFVATAGEKYMARYPRPVAGDATPEQQAWILAFLGTGLAAYINGENIFSDGGTSMGLMTGAIDPARVQPDTEENG